jgi:F0F1-type ATP synthase assembly protein I
VLTLVLAATSSHLTLFIVALCVGLVIGVFGHIIKSRPLIITGILMIGLISAYFSFVLQPGGK